MNNLVASLENAIFYGASKSKTLLPCPVLNNMLQMTSYMPRYRLVRRLVSRPFGSAALAIFRHLNNIHAVPVRSIYIAIIFSSYLPFAIAEVATPTDEQLENLIQEAEQIEEEQAAEAEKLKAETMAKQKAREAKTEKETKDAAATTDTTVKSEENRTKQEELFGDFIQIPDGTVVIQGNVIAVKSFKLARHAITYEQWQKIAADSVPLGSNCDGCIVTKVTWAQVQQFIDKLNNSSKHKYRLPTSVEWIYACKKGNKEKNCSGNNIDASYIPITESTAVKSLEENEFGIIGLGDKIFEWTCSKFSERYKQDYWNNCLGSQSHEYAAIHGRHKDIGTVEYNFLSSNLLATTHKPAGTGFRLVLE